jgi:uncharacterized protein involved in response to NO
MMPLMRIEEPRPARPPRFALFALGFRPFYLMASAFAALSIGLWALQFTGLLANAYLAGPIWHAHEMVFGFALAVIVGFLFTAGRNWTEQATPTGSALAALAALWLAGRVLVLTPHAVAAAVVNVAFPLAAAVGLAVPFIKARARRNYFFVALLVLFAGAAAWVHLTQLGVVEAPARRGIAVALDAVLFIVSVMGGRVIPMFTNNGVPGASARRQPQLERAVLALVLLLLAADALALQGWPLAGIAAAAALAHGARWWLWQPWVTRRTPLVWVLHLAYLWVPLHLALRAAAALGAIVPTIATHALTVGAVGGLIIGMMVRTARGHTARRLQADRFDVACFVLVALAALVRVAPPLAGLGVGREVVWLSAALWSTGFGLYAVRYWPVLTRGRLDGRPG